MQALEDADIDIAFITETWLEEHSGNIVCRIKVYSFNIHRTDRGSRGGGIAVLYRNINCNPVVFLQCVSSAVNSFEYHAIQLKSTQETFYIICLYRKQEIQMSDFIYEVDILLDYVTNKLAGTIIVYVYVSCRVFCLHNGTPWVPPAFALRTLD